MTLRPIVGHAGLGGDDEFGLHENAAECHIPNGMRRLF